MSPLSQVNEQWNLAFQEQKSAGEMKDAIWSRANRVAIQSLNTGCCIVDCEHPEEQNFRQIPEELCAQFRSAVESNDQDKISQQIQAMILSLKESPEKWFPQFIAHNWGVNKLQTTAFSSYRKNYQEVNGIPNNPFRLWDVVQSKEGESIALFKVESPEEKNELLVKYTLDYTLKIQQYMYWVQTFLAYRNIQQKEDAKSQMLVELHREIVFEQFKEGYFFPEFLQDFIDGSDSEIKRTLGEMKQYYDENISVPNFVRTNDEAHLPGM